MLDAFLNEVSSDLKSFKSDYEKSNDEKSYLSSIKNISGNVFNDEELLELTKLNDENFIGKIKDKYETKRNERIKLIGEQENNEIEKKLFLQILDFSWRSHLQYLEELRQVIGLRSYGQKDPLSEFKKEAFVLFENLLKKIKIDIIKFLLNLNIIFSKEKKDPPSEKKKQTINNKKVGRNEKCPCGSGKKFKHCHGTV